MIDLSRVELPAEDTWFMPMAIVSAEPELSKHSLNGMLKLRLSHPEFGEVLKWLPVQGWDSAMRPLSRLTIELLRSVGYTAVAIHALIERRELTSEQLANAVAGKIALVELGIERYQDKEQITVKRFLPATAMRLPKDWAPPPDAKADEQHITLTVLPVEVKQIGSGG